MMKFMLSTALALLAAAPARAQLSGCQLTTGPLQLQKVRSTASGTQIFGCLNASFDLLSSSGTNNSTSAVHTANWLQTQRISGISTGTANIWVSSPTILSVATSPFDSTFVFISSGSLLIQSTSSTAGHPVFTVRDASAGSILRIMQSGGAFFTSGITASSGTFNGGGGVSVTYGLSAATAALTGVLTASSASLTGTAGAFAVTSSTGIRIETGRLSFGTGGFLEYADGSTQKTAGGGGDVNSGNSNNFNGAGTNQTFGSSVTINGALYGNVSPAVVSSCTVVPSGSFTNTTFGVGYATVTMTTNGIGPLTVWSNVEVEGDNGSRVYQSGFLVDGSFPAGTTASTTVGFKQTRFADAATTSVIDLSLTHVLDGATGGTIPAAGSHKFILTFRTDAGTGYVIRNAVGTAQIAQFCVRQN